MGIEQFAPARDFFYLTAVFMGAGIGCILNRFRRQSSSRFRDSCVTVALCFFSLAVVALTAAVIYSNWTIFKELSLYLPAGVLTAIVVLCFRFPRAAGFPAFLVAGVIVVWVGFTSQRFPIIKDFNIMQVSKEESGSVTIHPSPTKPSLAEELAPSLSFQPEKEDSSLEFHATFLSYSWNFPLVGGVNRGLVTEILKDGVSIYSNPRVNRNPSPGAQHSTNSLFSGVFDRFLSFLDVSAKMDLGELPPGKARTLLFDGNSLVFR